MGKKTKLAIAAVATAVGAAGAGVLIRKSTGTTKGPATSYRASPTSKTLHQIGCRHFDSKKLTRVFATVSEAVDAGYRPCRICIS